MKFNERLKHLRQSRSLTQEQVSRIVGLSRSAIASYETGSREPDYDTLKLLADYYNVSMDFLLDDNHDIDGKRAESTFSKYRGSTEGYFRVPVLGSVVAGIPIEAIQDIEDYEEIKSAMGDPRDYFALRVRGRSMEPRLMDGDTIIVKKQEDVDSGQTAVVLINGNEGTVKQVKKSSKGILLIGFNQAVYEPHFYTNEEIEELPVRIAGVVVESRHKW